MRAVLPRFGPWFLLFAGVVTVFWKLVLTDQYTFADNPDLANQVLPWLNAQIVHLRRGTILLWTPYEWFGQPLIGQVQAGVTSPFTFLLAVAPLRDGHLQLSFLHIWYVAIHCAAAAFAYLLLRDLGCAAGAAVVGGIFYATAGYCGNTEWPQMLAPGIWGPLVFLFLLRSMRGHTPWKSAGWAGAVLGVSWLCGHHEPALMLTLAVLAVAVAHVIRSDRRLDAAGRMALVFCVMALVSAVQVLPALEYGKLAKRWTLSGGLAWQDKVHVREHEKFSLPAPDLARILLPGGNALRTDPFVGVVGLSLAALAVCAAFRRWEVRLFTLLAVGALLYAMARHNPLYGWLYALFPLVEKARSPVMAMSVFHLSVAVLAGIGAHLLISKDGPGPHKTVTRAVVFFAAAMLALTLFRAVRPSPDWNADPRLAATGLIAALLAAVYGALWRGYLPRTAALSLIGLLLVVEQGSEVGWNWGNLRDEQSGRFLKPLFQTADIATFIRGLPAPKRIHVNDADVKFSFGDWYRVDAGFAPIPSMLLQTSELNWWQERLIRMYGIDYEISREPTRSGQQELFRGESGLKVFRNPDAFPRAWTVHDVIAAKDEDGARKLVRDGTFDLRASGVMTGSQPSLSQCSQKDKVGLADVKPHTVRVPVEMGCRGILIVSDNWYPGWYATVDGRSAPLWRIDATLRGVPVEPGSHEVVMRYRPGSVRFGLALTIAGLLAAVGLQVRKEKDAGLPIATAASSSRV